MSSVHPPKVNKVSGQRVYTSIYCVARICAARKLVSALGHPLAVRSVHRNRPGETTFPLSDVRDEGTLNTYTAERILVWAFGSQLPALGLSGSREHAPQHRENVSPISRSGAALC